VPGVAIRIIASRRQEMIIAVNPSVGRSLFAVA